MPTLYLLRHAAPQSRGVLLGQCDPPLSERPCISVPEVSAIYCSPLRRARETAAALDVEYHVLDDLREITYGPWDGQTWEQIEEKWPELAQRKLADWFGVTPPGGESWTNFQHRILCALNAILQGPLPALIISHEAVHSVMAARLSGIDPHRFKQAYGELIELTFSSGTDPIAAEQPDQAGREPR